jgi:four helix bundle protein
MKDFKELRVWSKAHELTVLVYKLTRAFPRDEVYGLTSQVRRSAASIGANIAEGCGRRSDGEMARFLQIARGSASETEYHLLLAKDLGFLQEGDFRAAEESVVAVQRMLTALVQKVQPRGRKSKAEQLQEGL